MCGAGDLTMRRPHHGTQQSGREKERPMEGARGPKGGVVTLARVGKSLTKWILKIDGI